MALPDSDKVIQELNRRFAVPLPEFYKRRIIFWYDEDRDFEEKVLNGEIELTDAKLIALDEMNNFEVKKLLTYDDKTSNYCVYCPVTYSDEKNWLLPIQLYSEEFRADLVSIWLEEMGIENTANLRKTVKDYRPFFKTKAHRTKVANLGQKITAPVQLLKAIMAVLCGVKKTDPNLLIRTVLRAGMDQEQNGIYQSLVKFSVDKVFWQMVAQVTGYREETPDLVRLSCHILMTATTRTMRMDNLVGLDSFISIPHQSYCYDFMSEWMHSDETRELYAIARNVEDELRLLSRFSQLPIEELVGTEIFPCIDECILQKLMTDIIDHTINVDVITDTVEKRRTTLWYERVQNFYEGILEVAHMQKFYLDHSAGFHTVEPHKVWKEYTTDYYRMDTCYRLFHVAFGKSLNSSNPLLDDLFKHVADNVEGLYANWYLDNLGSDWTNAAADNLREYGKILEVPQQTDFYRTKVQNADTRVFVIISDAMRYEVAAALSEELRRETQAEVKISSCEGIFPTVTKFGMTALLPNKKISVEPRSNGVLGVLADGQPADAPYRDGILKAANPASVGLKYKDIIKMKRAERSALVKGMDVVYIYHDKIDETSHTDESEVFNSCVDTISELKNMVRIIVNEFSGTRIFITSDHGFIYTYKPLMEDAKVDKTTSSSDDVEVDRRYLITKKGARPEYMLPVKFLDGTQYDAFAPIGNTRIKKKGGGLNFVHGGISLQEMVVPIIDYHYMRTDSAGYQKNKKKYDTKPVSLNLLSSSRKISNMIFSLNFYQKEAVGANREAANYLLYFVDSEGTQVSDTQRVIADKTSDNNQDRTFRVSFNLKSMKYSNKESYYLVIADESGLQLPQREEFQIDIAFAVDDFDFFS
ncbi:BREX-1 system phosphatase PglZ type A [Acidaminococcus provencensis]|uniref:BREX-1 system phosphatase PglZ type A n=1 Tax=Acidaminococcus provencensis TaxID=2058289 RepID=UPI0022DF9D75|nr:BREX-1 system phosphatase PglZ type A [Acidaminococcus provencensis]